MWCRVVARYVIHQDVRSQGALYTPNPHFLSLPPQNFPFQEFLYSPLPFFNHRGRSPTLPPAPALPVSPTGVQIVSGVAFMLALTVAVQCLSLLQPQPPQRFHPNKRA
jgi:hypothetical protein